jgi:putative ABC transport system ATP-binding protein
MREILQRNRSSKMGGVVGGMSNSDQSNPVTTVDLYRAEKPWPPEKAAGPNSVIASTRDGKEPEKLEPAFVARGISKIYQMGDVQVHALTSVDLELFDGELIVLLGASGSGKSTLLNILGGLDVPTSGEVFYRDHNLSIDDDAELTRYRREHVGFVFQFYNLIPSLTALENVELVTDIAENPMRADDALELVGLGSRMNHFPAQLSGGEQQRVAIARAVAKRPEVLLCDEPTGALDYATGKLVLEAIERVNRELGTTTAIITHNAAIAGMADRVLRMRSGRIAEVHRNEKKAAPADLVW